MCQNLTIDIFNNQDAQQMNQNCTISQWYVHESVNLVPIHVYVSMWTSMLPSPCGCVADKKICNLRLLKIFLQLQLDCAICIRGWGRLLITGSNYFPSRRIFSSSLADSSLNHFLAVPDEQHRWVANLHLLMLNALKMCPPYSFVITSNCHAVWKSFKNNSYIRVYSKCAQNYS